jgi:predicted outer membrane repeat protein
VSSLRDYAVIVIALFIGSFNIAQATDYNIDTFSAGGADNGLLDDYNSSSIDDDSIFNILAAITFGDNLTDNPDWATLSIRGWDSSGGGAYKLQTLDGDNSYLGFSLTNKTIDFSYLSFENFKTSTYGGVIYADESIITFDGQINFINNTAGNAGGAIYAEFGSSVGFIAGGDILFIGNTAAGLANDIYLDNALLYMDAKNYQITMDDGIKAYNGSTITWQDTGDGVWVLGGINEFDNLGLFQINHGSITVMNASWTWTNNDNVDLDLMNSTMSFINTLVNFENNTTNDHGGAIFPVNSQLNFINSSVSFINNKSPSDSGGYSGDGGALDIYWYSQVNFENSIVSFTNNYALHEGGAIVLEADNSETYFLQATFENSTVSFTNNSSNYGGAIVLYRSQANFTKSEINFTSNIAAGAGGAIGIELVSRLNFRNSSVSFTSNTAGQYGGAIFLEIESEVNFIDSLVSFIDNAANIDNSAGGAIWLAHNSVSPNNSQINFTNSTVSFTGNTAGYGGAIYLADSGSELIFSNTEAIFEGNKATTVNGGNDIYNQGVINILAKSEVILRSGINGGGSINIENAVLRVSADNSNANEITVNGGMFSLVDVGNTNEYSTKTFSVNVLNLINGGTLEIGIVLSTNASDLIDLENGEMKIDVGSKLNIRYFGQWQSIESYVIAKGTINNDDWKNFNYNKNYYSLDYDKDGKRLLLSSLINPNINSSIKDMVNAVFVANVIREIGRVDNSEIYENSHKDVWVLGGVKGAKVHDLTDKGYEAKAGIAIIRKENWRAGIYGGYLSGAIEDESNEADIEGTEAGIYGSYLFMEKVKLQGVAGYRVSTVKLNAKKKGANFETQEMRFGIEGEYETGKQWSPFISVEGSEISHKEIKQYDEETEIGIIEANQYLRMDAKGGVKIKLRGINVRGYMGYTMDGLIPELKYRVEDEELKAKAAEQSAIFFGLGIGGEIPVSRNISAFANGRMHINNDYFTYGVNAGLNYKFAQNMKKPRRHKRL